MSVVDHVRRDRNVVGVKKVAVRNIGVGVRGEMSEIRVALV